MRMKLLMLLAAAVLLVPSPSAAQIGQTADVDGHCCRPERGGSPRRDGHSDRANRSSEGVADAVTDENGVYRFPSLPPGTYAVSAQLSGFKPFTQAERPPAARSDDYASIQSSRSVAFEDRVTVAGGAPVVDVKASAAQKNLTEEVMENVPFSSRFGPAALLVAPGVNPMLSATGRETTARTAADRQSSNSYMVDGVDVSDPESGTIWLFSNHNWIQEVQVIGLGAAAEYGGFTGVASNSLFRSGSNQFSGLFETLFENDALTGDNVSR